MKKSSKLTMGVLCALLLLWSVVFAVDCARCTNLKEPLFVLPGITADDGGSGTYQGLGYTVKVEKHLDAEQGVCIESVELSIFGKVVAASIA